MEIWVRGSGTAPGGPINQWLVPDPALEFEQGTLKTGAQGAFQTPPTLPCGSSDRASIRREGFLPFPSEWVTLPDIAVPV